MEAFAIHYGLIQTMRLPCFGRYLNFKTRIVEVFGIEAFTACKAFIVDTLLQEFPVPQ